MRKSQLLVLSVAVAIVAAACGIAQTPNAGVSDVPSTTIGQVTSAAPTPPPTQPTIVAEFELTARCGLAEFDANSIDLNRFEPFTGDWDELTRGQTQADYQVAYGWWDAFDWSVAVSIDTSLVLFGQKKQPTTERLPFANAIFEFGDQGWRSVEMGRCRIEMGRDGFGTARFTIDPETPPNPDTTNLSLLATEGACASGRAPVDREVIAVVVETDTAVDITTLIELASGLQTCPSNPSFSMSVPLSTPLGDRSIRNTASYPLGDLVWPLPLEDLFLALRTGGDPPASGAANVIAWSGEQSGALSFGTDRWNPDPTFIQGFEAPGPMIISGFVTLCDETAGCPEELEASEVETIPRVGAECTLIYTPARGQNITMTIRFSDGGCAIDVAIGPID